jgi:hypothetical protein
MVEVNRYFGFDVEEWLKLRFDKIMRDETGRATIYQRFLGALVSQVV